MKTSRKPAPIQANPEPWAVQFVRFVEHVGTTASDQDAAVQAVTLALGCMADLANVSGDEYRIALNAARDYARCIYWMRIVINAANVDPWNGHEDGPSRYVQHAHHCRSCCLDALRDALSRFRPSLPMT